MSKFSTRRNSIMVYKCTIPPRESKPGDQITSIIIQIHYLGLNSSCTLNFRESALRQVAKANGLLGVLQKLKFKEGSLHVFKPASDPLCLYMRLCNSVALEIVECAITRQFTGFSSNLIQMERCGLPRLDPLWIQRARENLVLSKGMAGDDCVIAPRDKNPLTCSPLKTCS